MRHLVGVDKRATNQSSDETIRPTLVGSLVVYLALSPLAYAGIDGLIHDQDKTAALAFLAAYAACAAYVTGYSIRMTRTSISFRRLGFERWKADFNEARAVQSKDRHYGMLDIIEVRSLTDDEPIGSFSKPAFHATDVEKILSRFARGDADPA